MFINPSEIVKYFREKKYILPGMTGADFGCGGGYFTYLLANEVGPEGKIYAIDVQEEVLKEAQEFINNFALGNVKFVLQDLEHGSGVDDNCLDFVFISQVLYQSGSPEKILISAKKALKDNGFLIILEPEPENFLFSGQNIYNLDELKSLIENQKFKIIDYVKIKGYNLLISQK